MIKTFKKFNSVNEELEMSNDLYGILEILKARGIAVAEFLMKVRITRDFFDFPTDFIDLSSDINELSFLAKNRANNNPDMWLENYEDSKRQSIKTGRLVRRIINDFPKLDFTHSGKIYVVGTDLTLDSGLISQKMLSTINVIARFNGSVIFKGTHTKENKEITSTFKLIRGSFLEKWANNNHIFDSGDFAVSVKSNSEVYTGLYDGELTFTCEPKYTDSEIELFVNEFLALRKELNLEESGMEFKIVEGGDVAKYYHYSNYYGYDKNIKKGTLWNSCMRMDRCQKYFSIYTENPNQVKMLVLASNDGKAIGRALLWNLDNISDSDPDKKYSLEGKFMDRIYSINDSDEKLFINYAIKNGWSYRDNTKTICVNREQLPNAILRVSLENSPSGEYYPYVDTLSYFTDNKDVLMLSNVPEYDSDYVLNSTTGTWQGADEDYDDPEIEDGDDD